MDLKELEKELRYSEAPFQKCIKIDGKLLIAQINNKKEVIVITDDDRYKYKHEKFKLKDSQFKKMKLDLYQVAKGERYEELLQELIKQNTAVEYSNKFPNIKQFMLMLKRIKEEIWKKFRDLQ